MHLGWWFRRIAAATVLTLCVGLVALNGSALGLELPTVDPALGSGTSLPGTSTLPSTSGLAIDPQQLIAPTVPVTSVTPAPAGPTGPSGPAGATAGSTAGSSTGAVATLSRLHKGNLASSGRLRNLISGDNASSPNASGNAAGARRVRRASTSGRHAGSRSRGRSSSNSGFQLFHPSQLDHLGRIIGQQTSPAGFVGRFSPSATGRADWAPPLLTVMLLIGLGGFLRVALPAPRRPQQ
jgi:hypothetical protein